MLLGIHGDFTMRWATRGYIGWLGHGDEASSDTL